MHNVGLSNQHVKNKNWAYLHKSCLARVNRCRCFSFVVSLISPADSDLLMEQLMIAHHVTCLRQQRTTWIVEFYMKVLICFSLNRHTERYCFGLNGSGCNFADTFRPHSLVTFTSVMPRSSCPLKCCKVSPMFRLGEKFVFTKPSRFVIFKLFRIKTQEASAPPLSHTEPVKSSFLLKCMKQRNLMTL